MTSLPLVSCFSMIVLAFCSSQVNPLPREERHACPAADLSDTHFLARISNQSSRPRVPSNQPNNCPSSMNSWWPRAEDSLRSNCPWKVAEVDLGENAYPRYILEATCLCEMCINSPLMGCMNFRQDVTYFERQGCQYGLALMNVKTINVVVGCYCVHASPQVATEEVITDVTDDW